MTTSDLQMLLDMGFDPTRANLAIKKSGNLNGAIEWLEANQDKSIESIQAEAAEAAEAEAEASNSNVEALKEGETAKSLVCNECGKKFRSMEAAEFHASKTEHTDFAESVEEIAPLTEVEKKQRLDDLREKLKAKKAAQAEIDKEDHKKNEKIRQKSTKEVSDLKEELARKKAIDDAVAKRKEQAEDRQYMKQLRAKIEADKIERKRKFEEEKARRDGRLPQYEGGPSQSPAAAAAAIAVPKSAPGDVRLKLMVQGGPVMKKYGPETTLFEVAEDIKATTPLESVGSFKFQLGNKNFDSVDFGQTLKEAGLAPSAILIVNP